MKNRLIVLKNLTAVLEAAGSHVNNIVKTTVFLQSMDDYKAVNAIYASYLGNPPHVRLWL
ncbi:hypothetical protein MASR2M15_29520 [Anaerolineales bacterium]